MPFTKEDIPAGVLYLSMFQIASVEHPHGKTPIDITSNGTKACEN
jgi:hypothetical protein